MLVRLLHSISYASCIYIYIPTVQFLLSLEKAHVMYTKIARYSVIKLKTYSLMMECNLLLSFPILIAVLTFIELMGIDIDINGTLSFNFTPFIVVF